jgi:hypothetical protein
MRPLQWHPTTRRTTNFSDHTGNILPAYDIDYPDEYDWWEFGGFRYRPFDNIDYRHENNNIYTSKPITGYIPKYLYCTRAAWSLDRPLNTQDVPNLKTFLSSNVYDISDDTGCIDYAYDCIVKGVPNLYAVTDHGVCQLITEKNVLSQDTGGTLSSINTYDPVTGLTAGKIITGQNWIDKEHGMDNEMWRSAAEGDNILMWTNIQSVYTLDADVVTDIGGKYHKKIKEYLDVIDGSYSKYVCAGYDKYHKEYWVQIDKLHIPLSKPPTYDTRTFVYNYSTEHWNGYYTYKYDKYVAYDNRMFGVGSRYPVVIKLAQTYELNKGNIIGGRDIDYRVMVPFAPSGLGTKKAYTSLPKEYKRMRVSSSDAPTQINFYDTVEQYESGQIQSQLFESDFKNYHNFEQFIPRRLATVDANRSRMQGRSLIAEIIYNKVGGNADYKVITASVMYKEIL